MGILKKLVIVFLISYFTIISLTGSLPLKANEISKNTTEPIKYIERIKPSKAVVTYANQIVENKIYLGNQFPVYQLKKEVTWKENPYNNRTWQLFFHSLEHVGYLLSAYEYTNDVKYLKKSESIISSWKKYNGNPQKAASPWAWYTNSTPIRTVYLIQFEKLYQNSSIFNKKFYNEVLSLIEQHGSYLADQKNYVWESNHGIFQDQALLEIAKLFPELSKSKAWYDTATNRLIRHIEKLITKEGVTNEHSISYQIVVLDLLKQISPLLDDLEYTKIFVEDKIGMLEDSLATLLQPNGTIPLYGDSKNSYVVNNNINDIRGYKLKFLASNGAIGTNPYTDILYKESGISVFRNESNHFQSYLFFVSAFHSTVHKHADDLSFIFMKGKTEFFVDSGLYNYELNDSMRKYMTSTYAHNTITVDNKSYEIKKENIDQAVIQNGDIESDYSYVVGKHELYPGVTINRVMLYVKNTDSILIFDKMNSKKLHTYTKVFNVGENVNVSQKAQNQFLLASKIESNQVELINLDSKSTYQSYFGSKTPLAGFKSNVFNKVIPIQQIRFSTKDKAANFRTILNAENGKGISNFYVTGDHKILNFDLHFKDGTNKNIKVNLY